MRTLRILAIGIAVFLASCGGETAGVLPSTTTLPPASEPLVEFEASWLCQVQRFAFTDLSDIDSEKDVALESAGFSHDEYVDFETRLDTDSSLRTEVKDRFLAECAAVETVIEDVEA